ncbi:hypothetical protein [Micromonospora sp. NPDC007220]|uniref:hypothetical protein n=1 Tax=Micromonospora sp. NPDC007220 TaxID=3154318 RepID=UPI0033FB5BC4
MAVAERGHGYVRTALEENGARRVPGTDLAWLADGYAAVTAVRALGDLLDLVVPTAGAGDPAVG